MTLPFWDLLDLDLLPELKEVIDETGLVERGLLAIKQVANKAKGLTFMTG